MSKNTVKKLIKLEEEPNVFANIKVDHPEPQTCYARFVQESVKQEEGMLSMVDKEYIRKKHFLEGWSIRELSRQLKIPRQTVRKMLKDGDIPKYNRTKPKLSPVMDPYREIIENILEMDKSAPPKQRIIKMGTECLLSLISYASR